MLERKHVSRKLLLLWERRVVKQETIERATTQGSDISVPEKLQRPRLSASSAVADLESIKSDLYDADVRLESGLAAMHVRCANVSCLMKQVVLYDRTTGEAASILALKVRSRGAPAGSSGDRRLSNLPASAEQVKED